MPNMPDYALLVAKYNVDAKPRIAKILKSDEHTDCLNTMCHIDRIKYVLVKDCAKKVKAGLAICPRVANFKSAKLLSYKPGVAVIGYCVQLVPNSLLGQKYEKHVLVSFKEDLKLLAKCLQSVMCHHMYAGGYMERLGYDCFLQPRYKPVWKMYYRKSAM